MSCFEWTVRYSKTRVDGTRISYEAYKATVYAADEDEVRAIMAEEEPGMDIDEITRGDEV